MKEIDKTSANAAKGEKDNVRIDSFLLETKGELEKVVWPSNQELIAKSVGVIVMLIVVATLVNLVDSFFAWMSKIIF